MMMNYHREHPHPVQFANEQEVIQSAGRHAIAAFLEDQTCFSILRPSGKVVVFDTRIPIQLAFYALVEHGALIRCSAVVESCCCWCVLRCLHLQ